MSPTCPVTAISPSSNFQLIFGAALKAYERRTKTDLLAHPLASQLQACNSPGSILANGSALQLTSFSHFQLSLAKGLVCFLTRESDLRGCWRPPPGGQDVGVAQEALIDTFEHSVGVNAQTSDGHTSLHRTSKNGHVDIGRLDHGAEPMARDREQMTSLHLASLYGKLEVAHLLLERGVDVDAEDDEDNTAYQIARNWGYDEITQLLSGHGVENKT
ncbi:ankyrin repeat-containing domain protein [Lactarius psammicola]|nr:ankyrin repeat-containing domain protein [Lactarius psammicola]